MPEWLSVILGIVLGTCIIIDSLIWAFKPRRPRKKNWLAPPSGYDGDGGMPPGGFGQ